MSLWIFHYNSREINKIKIKRIYSCQRVCDFNYDVSAKFRWRILMTRNNWIWNAFYELIEWQILSIVSRYSINIPCTKSCNSFSIYYEAWIKSFVMRMTMRGKITIHKYTINKQKWYWNKWFWLDYRVSSALNFIASIALLCNYNTYIGEILSTTSHVLIHI